MARALDAAAELLGLLPLAAIAVAARRHHDLPVGRCLVCKDRPERYSYDVYSPPYDPPPSEEELAACAGCGWAPFYIQICYTDGLTGRVYSPFEVHAQVIAREQRLANGGTWADEIEMEKARVQRQ